jgi:hypothetical protein
VLLIQQVAMKVGMVRYCMDLPNALFNQAPSCRMSDSISMKHSFVQAWCRPLERFGKRCAQANDPDIQRIHWCTRQGTIELWNHGSQVEMGLSGLRFTACGIFA